MKFQILLFYKYTEIDDPELEKARQVELFQKYNLKGRMILATEGVNATLEGTLENTENYIVDMKSDPRFADVDWKKSEGTGNAFPKASIKVRPEIVSLGLDHNIDPSKTRGKYITADELHDLYESGEEFYVVDMRNDYEQKVGHFEDAILMPIQNFREIPENMDAIAHLKGKKVVTTCTGGIRCEKASGFLVENGFADVYQLYGGMQTYMEAHPNKHFLGKLYVFDGRIVWGVNVDSPEHKVISTCELCGAISDSYSDCAYIHCTHKRHIVACQNCRESNGDVFCTPECKEKAMQLREVTVEKAADIG